MAVFGKSRKNLLKGMVSWNSIGMRRSLCSIPMVTQNIIPGTSLLAYIMAPTSQLSFEEAIDHLKERQDLVSLWNKDMLDGGMNVIYSDPTISIIDYEEDDENKTLCRGLFFNENLNLVQTSVPLNKQTKKVDFTIPFPFESNKHIVGFSFALLFRFMNQQSTAPLVNRSAILGAGGCSLPVLLSLLYPHSNIDAVEINSSIVEVAKEYFGIAALGLNNRIHLHESCAMKWIEEKSREIQHHQHQHQQQTSTFTSQYDLLFLDIYSVPSSPVPMLTSEEDLEQQLSNDVAVEYEAPAAITLTNKNISHYLNLLSDSGVMAINVLGDDLGTAVALHRIEDGVIEYLISLPDNMIAPQFAVGIMNLPFESTHSTQSNDATMDPQETSLPKYNSIVFILKNSNALCQELVGGNERVTEKIIEAMRRFVDHHHHSHSQQQQDQDHESRVSFPFERHGKEFEIVRNWMKTVKFVEIQR